MHSRSVFLKLYEFVVAVAETNTITFSTARTLLAGLGAPPGASPPNPAAGAASLPSAPRPPALLCAPAAAAVASVPPAGSMRTPAVFVHGAGSGREAGSGLRFPSGASVLHLAGQLSRPGPPSRQIWILFHVPLHHPVSPDGKWSPRLEEGGGCSLLFMFFFSFFYFS